MGSEVGCQEERLSKTIARKEEEEEKELVFFLSLAARKRGEKVAFTRKL